MSENFDVRGFSKRIDLLEKTLKKLQQEKVDLTRRVEALQQLIREVKILSEINAAQRQVLSKHTTQNPDLAQHATNNTNVQTEIQRIDREVARLKVWVASLSDKLLDIAKSRKSRKHRSSSK